MLLVFPVAGFVDIHLSLLFAVWLLQALCLVISRLEPQGESSFGEKCSCQAYRKLSQTNCYFISCGIIVLRVPENTDTHHCDVTTVDAELLELLFSRH